MKKNIILLAVLLLPMTATGQTDIKKFLHMSPTQVQKTLGYPQTALATTWVQDEYTGNGVYLVEKATNEPYDPAISLAKTSSGYTLEMFSTSKPDFLFLTNYIRGGVKVGDDISKVRNYKFSGTKFGRNKPGNNCRQAGEVEGQNCWIIFGEEAEYIQILTQGSTIVSIGYFVKEDLPYQGYDTSNTMF